MINCLDLFQHKKGGVVRAPSHLSWSWGLKQVYKSLIFEFDKLSYKAKIVEGFTNPQALNHFLQALG